MSFLRAEIASGAFGSAWFAWQWLNLKRESTGTPQLAAAAIREVEAILGYRRRRSAMLVHNGLSATRPYER